MFTLVEKAIKKQEVTINPDLFDFLKPELQEALSKVDTETQKSGKPINSAFGAIKAAIKEQADKLEEEITSMGDYENYFGYPSLSREWFHGDFVNILNDKLFFPITMLRTEMQNQYMFGKRSDYFEGLEEVNNSLEYEDGDPQRGVDLMNYSAHQLFNNSIQTVESKKNNNLYRKLKLALSFIKRTATFEFKQIKADPQITTILGIDNLFEKIPTDIFGRNPKTIPFYMEMIKEFDTLDSVLSKSSLITQKKFMCNKDTVVSNMKSLMSSIGIGVESVENELLPIYLVPFEIRTVSDSFFLI
jgi:hypothetical protein